jgi:hypothetical protein
LLFIVLNGIPVTSLLSGNQTAGMFYLCLNTVLEFRCSLLAINRIPDCSITVNDCITVNPVVIQRINNEFLLFFLVYTVDTLAIPSFFLTVFPLYNCEIH